MTHTVIHRKVHGWNPKFLNSMAGFAMNTDQLTIAAI